MHSTIAAAPRPRFVFVDGADSTERTQSAERAADGVERGIAVVASGCSERVESDDFAVVDDAWADGRLWLLRAPFSPRGRVTLWRPREAWCNDGNGTTPTAHIDADGRRTVLSQRFALDTDGPRPAPALVLDDDAGRDAYEAAVRAALAAIARGDVDKLVVAREAALRLPGDVDLARLVAGLRGLAGSTAWALEDDDDGGYDDGGDAGGPGLRVFCGASPEHLLRKSGDRLEVDAVAGTRPLSDAAALLASDKDRREHQLVVDGVVNAIGGVAGATRLITRGPLAHLGAVVSARVAGGPAAQMRALHPTAATAGWPRGRAEALLHDVEGFDRGGYGGLVGVVHRQRCSIAVCLRCARIDGRDVVVTAGAGVVAGSDPASEWRETQQKARVLLPALARAVTP